MYIKMTQQCVATTKGNQRCKNQAKKDHELCASHYRKKYGSNTKNEKGEPIEKKHNEPEEPAEEISTGFLAPTTMKPIAVKSSPRRRLSPRRLSPYRKTSPRRLSPGRRGTRRMEDAETPTKRTSSDSETGEIRKDEASEDDDEKKKEEKIAEKSPPSSPPKLLTRNENTKFLSFGTVKNKLLSPRRRLKRI